MTVELNDFAMLSERRIREQIGPNATGSARAQRRLEASS
jgi:hypothetical protein